MTLNLTKFGSRRDLLIFSILAAALVYTAYIYVYKCGFIWDDDVHVLDGAKFRGLSGLWRIWFTTGTQQYYPFVYTSLWIETYIWGFNPAGFHMVNAGIHALNSVMVYLLLRRLGIKGAAFAGLVFAIHPVHVESVAWISERKNLLSGLLYMLSLLSFLEFEDKKGWRLYALAFVLFCLALLTKSVVCTLPVVFILIRWMRRRLIDRGFIASTVPFFAAGLAMGIVTIWWERNITGASGRMWDFGLLERLMLPGRVAWFYITKLFYPSGLMFIYPRWALNSADIMQWLPTLFMAGAFAVLWGFRRTLGRRPLAALCYFVVTLFPALGFFDVFPFQFSFVADHFQYLASIGPIALASGVLAAGFNRLEGRWLRVKPLKIVLAAIILAVFWVLTSAQTRIYKDSDTVWEETLKKNPRAWIAHNNIGRSALSAGDFKTAYDHVSAAYDINPDNSVVQYNMGLIHYELSENLSSNGLDEQARDYNEKAMGFYREAIRLKRSYDAAYSNLGVSLVKAGRYDEAIELYRLAIMLNPEVEVYRGNLDIALRFKSGKVPGTRTDSP